MELFIDSADLGDLGTLPTHAVFAGVTTNPTLQRAAGLDDDELEELVQGLLEAGTPAVHMQVRAREADAIVEQGLGYAALGDRGRIFVKVPATRAGLHAVSRLAGNGIPCTVTAAFEVEQVLFAQTCGARYVAPYLGRMNDAGIEGLTRIARMQAVLDRFAPGGGPRCKLLVASVRTLEDLRSLLDIGADAATIKPDLARRALEHEATLRAETAFLADAAAANQRD